MSNSSHLSKELLDLVKSIGESRSKQEEDKIITLEAQGLKQKFLERNLPEKKMKELLIRAIYVEMLGHDASFSHIHAVNLAQSKNILVKRIGYLACSLFIDKSSDILILMIATVQKDLQSKNHLEVMAALNVISKLCHTSIIAAVQDVVFALMQHQQEMIRKKAVMVLISFNKIQPIENFDMHMKRALCDRDPSVMAASLNYYLDEVKKRPSAFKELINSFIIILKQVTEHRLPKDYDYHRMPAPWIQTKILEILSFLGAEDEESSSQMYEILTNVLRRADDMGINIGYALVYQCLKTITMIYPNQQLTTLASQTIARFLSSESHNLKYIGITGLASIVKIDPKYTLEYQSLVVDCLEDTDDTLKIKTLDLLYKMTNQVNVEAIVERLLSYLKEAPIEAGSRKDLVNKISVLGDSFAPNQNWYVRNMNRLFEIGGDQITQELTNKFIWSISEYERAEQGEKFRQSTIKIYLKILKKNPNIPDALMVVIAWILGEYGSNQPEAKVRMILNLLAQFSYGTFEHERTRAAILLALTKLHSALAFEANEYVQQVMNDYLHSRNLEVQQRAIEYKFIKDSASQLSNNGRELIFRIPLTESQVAQESLDFNLSFLDSFVQQQAAQGKSRYDPSKRQATITTEEDTSSGLIFTPYQQAQFGVTKHSQQLQESNPLIMTSGGGQAAAVNTGTTAPFNVTGINPGTAAAQPNATLAIGNVKRVWGVQSPDEAKAPEPTQTQPAATMGQPMPQTTTIGQKPGLASKKAPEPNKAERKRQKAAAALFGGISGQKEESSDDDDDSEATPTKPEATLKEQQPAPQQQNQVQDLLDLGGPSPSPAPSQPSQPMDLLGDLLGGPSQPQQPAPTMDAPVQGPIYRPCQITTPEFGGAWGTLPLEKSVQITVAGMTTTDAYKQIVGPRLGFHVVETINNEVISAGFDPGNSQVLLHCRVDPTGNLFFTIKTSQQHTIVDIEGRLLPSLAQPASQAAPTTSSNPLEGLF